MKYIKYVIGLFLFSTLTMCVGVTAMSVQETFNNREVGIYPLVMKSTVHFKTTQGPQHLITTKATKPVRARIIGEFGGSQFNTRWVNATVGGTITWTDSYATYDTISSTVTVQNLNKGVTSIYSGKYLF